MLHCWILNAAKVYLLVQHSLQVSVVITADTRLESIQSFLLLSIILCCTDVFGEWFVQSTFRPFLQLAAFRTIDTPRGRQSSIVVSSRLVSKSSILQYRNPKIRAIATQMSDKKIIIIAECSIETYCGKHCISYLGSSCQWGRRFILLLLSWVS